MSATLPADLFTHPHADLDDVAARIRTALAFASDRTAGLIVPADLAAGLGFARATLADLDAITRPFARHKAFRAEHGIEIMKDLWFAFADHAALLGLSVEAAP